MLNVVITADGEAMPRHKLEAYIESLIDLLDAMDGDCDLEDGADDEPYLADSYPVYQDREFDQAEHGIADQDGLAEQFTLSIYGATFL